ncbi:hypothetical protein [Streptomyces sp. NPDC057413]|uniref:hypothetical protein n=1 Tax=Streptomyces sp. NPDC057413 TaxID=3346124 RepID=UPI0036B0190F
MRGSGRRARIGGAAAAALLLGAAPAAWAAETAPAGPAASQAPTTATASASASASADPVTPPSGPVTPPSVTTPAVPTAQPVPAAPVRPAAPAAPAVPAAPSQADVRTTLSPEPATVAPGRVFQLNVSTDLITGTVPELAVVITLPRGLTYQRPTEHNDLEYIRCVPSADGRTVTCRSLDAPHEHVWEQLAVRIDPDVAVGTTLPITATTVIGDAVDTHPEDNTASVSVTAGSGPDLGVVWKQDRISVRPGEDVHTELVLTNHGPGAVRYTAVRFWMGWDYWPKPGHDQGCWADPGELTCDVLDLAAGESRTYSFTWNFPAKAAGTTYRVPTGVYPTGVLDPNPANDEAPITFTITKPAMPAPKPTPTGPATPAAPATPPAATGVTPQGGGGGLAATGSDGLPLAGAAAALVLTGGVLVARARGRRREQGSPAH